MDKTKNLMKNGWHPKSKEGGRESWRQEHKGINQVAGWVGHSKQPNTSLAQAQHHRAQPITALRDPASFGRPPTRTDTGSSSTGTGTSLITRSHPPATVSRSSDYAGRKFSATSAASSGTPRVVGPPPLPTRTNTGDLIKDDCDITTKQHTGTVACIPNGRTPPIPPKRIGAGSSPTVSYPIVSSSLTNPAQRSEDSRSPNSTSLSTGLRSLQLKSGLSATSTDKSLAPNSSSLEKDIASTTVAQLSARSPPPVPPQRSSHHINVSSATHLAKSPTARTLVAGFQSRPSPDTASPDSTQSHAKAPSTHVQSKDIKDAITATRIASQSPATRGLAKSFLSQQRAPPAHPGQQPAGQDLQISQADVKNAVAVTRLASQNPMARNAAKGYFKNALQTAGSANGGSANEGSQGRLAAPPIPMGSKPR